MWMVLKRAGVVAMVAGFVALGVRPRGAGAAPVFLTTF
jgi:hypothetical protein